jgi:phosphoribosylanthranilate isomerase
MLIKICGLCRPEDAALALAAGADCAGVVFVPGAPRAQTMAQAKAIFAAAGSLQRAGVFSDAAASEMIDAARALALNIVQLHGSEPPAAAHALRGDTWQVWKAVRPGSGAELLRAAERYSGMVDALLLDGHKNGVRGAAFDWEEIAKAREQIPAGLSILVAGGLTPSNVGEAIAALSPHGVDVSSGVEQRTGEKSPDLVRAFVKAARAERADSLTRAGT